jgi:hypothetical protein
MFQKLSQRNASHQKLYRVSWHQVSRGGRGPEEKAV